VKPLDKRKLELELIRVQAARMDMEIRIEEMKEEIARVQNHISIQSDKETELKQKLEEING
jgi:hypothetical protein